MPSSSSTRLVSLPSYVSRALRYPGSCRRSSSTSFAVAGSKRASFASNALVAATSAQVRVIATITDPTLVAQILEHIAAREAGAATARDPPLANALRH